MIIKLEFGKSTSQNYKRALNLLKKFDKYSLADDNDSINQVNIETEELHDKYTKLEKLYEIVKYWKSTTLYLDNNPVDIEEIKSIIKILACSDGYYKSVVNENYCSGYHPENEWGCKFLLSIYNGIPRYGLSASDNFKYWFQFGKFINETQWVIDKDRIKTILEKESLMNKLQHCKKFNLQDIYKAVDKLPNSIETKDSEEWEIKFEDIFNGNSVEKIKKGIQPKKDNSSPFSIKRSNKPNELGYGLSVDVNKLKAELIKNNANRYIPDIKFDEIGGIDDIIDKIREIIELPLKKPDLMKYMGIKPHKGILLYGPPGCGKTLVAKAIANEVNAHFISVNGPELLSKYHGQSEENFRDIFEEGRILAPSIIFFDEIDSIAQKRSGDENLRFDSRIVNQLLTLMDGVEDYENLRVIASTNMPDLIDDALLRPGRFDYMLEIKKPTKQGCFKIFNIHSKNMPVTPNFNKEYFSEKLEGLTGAEIAYVAYEGAYNCLRRISGSKELLSADIDENDFKKFVIIEDDFNNALNSVKLKEENGNE